MADGGPNACTSGFLTFMRSGSWSLCKVAKAVADIASFLAAPQDSMDSIEGFDARVIQCLQDYRDELVVPECKAQVHKLTERASQDIRFDEPLADACFEDRAKLCDGVQPVRTGAS